MLRKSLIASLAASILGLSALTLAPVSANAASVELRLGSHERGPSIVVRDNRDKRHYRDNRRHHRANICEPGRAVHEASRNGVRHAQVKRIDHRFIVVDGRKRGDRINIAFYRDGASCDVAWVKKAGRGGYRY